MLFFRHTVPIPTYILLGSDCKAPVFQKEVAENNLCDGLTVLRGYGLRGSLVFFSLFVLIDSVLVRSEIRGLQVAYFDGTHGQVRILGFLLTYLLLRRIVLCSTRQQTLTH